MTDRALLNIAHNWAGTREGREKTLEDNCLFGIGSRIRVTDTLPENMSHFSTVGRVGTVTGRDLTTDFGICDYGYYPIYVIHIDGAGKSAWYPENTLSKIYRQFMDIDEEILECTCDENCPNTCKGKCGCESCKQVYGDFLSLE